MINMTGALDQFYDVASVTYEARVSPLSCQVAIDFCTKYFTKSACELLRMLAREDRPSLSIILDEARIIKRDVLMTLITTSGDGAANGKVYAAPLQSLPDLDDSQAPEVVKASLFDTVSNQFLRRTGNLLRPEPKKKASHVVDCAPSKSLYAAAGKAVNLLTGFTFSLTRPHHAYRPAKANETRKELPNSRLHYFESPDGVTLTSSRKQGGRSGADTAQGAKDTVLQWRRTATMRTIQQRR
jgi:hypothetical protein